MSGALSHIGIFYGQKMLRAHFFILTFYLEKMGKNNRSHTKSTNHQIVKDLDSGLDVPRVSPSGDH